MTSLLEEIGRLRVKAQRLRREATRQRKRADYWRTRAQAAEWANRNRKEPRT